MTGPEPTDGDEGPPEAARDRPDPGTLLVGAFVGLAGLLFLAEPVVGPLPVGGARIRTFVLSAGVLGVGLALGAVVFRRRGAGRVAAAHAVGALAWLTLFLAASVGSPALVFAGVVVLVGGALFVVART